MARRVRASADSETFNSGGVPVRRIPLSLARRFFQICTAAVAEGCAAEGLTPLQGGVLAYLNKIDGEPDIDQNRLAARLGIDRASTSQLVDELAAMGLVERRVNDARPPRAAAAADAARREAPIAASTSDIRGSDDRVLGDLGARTRTPV